MKKYYLVSYLDKKVIISEDLPTMSKYGWVHKDRRKTLELHYNTLKIFDIDVDLPEENSIKEIYSEKLEKRFEQKLKFIKLFEKFYKDAEDIFGESFDELSFSIERQGDCSGIVKYNDNTTDFII